MANKIVFPIDVDTALAVSKIQKLFDVGYSSIYTPNAPGGGGGGTFPIPGTGGGGGGGAGPAPGAIPPTGGGKPPGQPGQPGHPGQPPGPNQPGNRSWSQMAMGALVGMFSPWMGARIMNQGWTGQGGKGMGGLLFGGGPMGFSEFYLGLITASKLLTATFNDLRQAVAKGANLYQQAARAGTSTGDIALLRSVLGGIGMSPEMATNMRLQMQSGRGGRVTDLYGTILRGTMSSGGLGDVQQIINMRKEIKYLGEATKVSSQSLAETSGAMNRISMDTMILKQDFQAMWAQILASMEEGIHKIITDLDSLFKAMPKYFDILKSGVAGLSDPLQSIDWENTNKLFGQSLFAKDKTSNIKIGGIGMGARPESGWEKMGLIVSGGIGGNNYARQTAENTKKIADYIRNLFPSATPAMGPVGTFNAFNAA